jgi:2Fe-2S ferredoxin
MPVLRVLPHAALCPAGAELRATPGTTVCEALLEGGIDIEHACEMSCACTTCHVVVKQGYASLGTPEEGEEDLLDRAWGLTPTSRLSCQAVLGREDVTVEIPKYTINHARERG